MFLILIIRLNYPCLMSVVEHYLHISFVPVPPATVLLRKLGDSGNDSVAVLSGSAGSELGVECVSEGGNPAPRLVWQLEGQDVVPGEQQEELRLPGGRWRAVSRLRLPVSHEDNGAHLHCRAEHDALDGRELATEVDLNIFYPPRVSVRASRDTQLAEGEAVTLTCDVDSNPPASLSWRKLEKTTRLLGSQPALTVANASPSSAGSYQCTAENELGRSQPETIVLDVQCKLDNLLAVRCGLGGKFGRRNSFTTNWA